MAHSADERTDPEGLADRIAAHVATLCGLKPDRSPGTQGNRLAAAYVEDVLRTIGLEVESLPFQTVGWRSGQASVRVGGTVLPAHPGPYSPAFDGSAPLAAASCVPDLEAPGVRGSILVLHGPLAAEQLTPRGYPWYSDPGHDAILDAIETAEPAAVLAATGKNPATTGALSPFPLIEDAAFPLPSAYLEEGRAAELLRHVGDTAHVLIDSERFDVGGTQPIGRIAGRSSDVRVLVTSHLDTKPGTPGALDNASGVATMLAVAELLAADPPAGTLEFLAFNGEDHYASPGEVAYLEANPSTDDISLVVNVDGAGARGGPSAVSRYNTTRDIDGAIDATLRRHPTVIAGDPWFSGDHAIFAMRGVPALALTSADMRSLWDAIAHTRADTDDLIDPVLLAGTARFIADVIRALPG